MKNKNNLSLLVITGLALIGLFYGWRLFWFLTDDAFIAFRYVSNSILGFGYTWNAPPFQPVEGYTSFLWVVLLDVVWRLIGVEPPQSANGIALIFSAGTLILGILMLHKMQLRTQLGKIRYALLLLVLIGVLTNRTFLAWTSSGLETAMFIFWVTAWVYSALFVERRSNRWLGGMMGTAVLVALTRPDGLLMVAATCFIALLIFIDRWQTRQLMRPFFVAISPIGIVLAHLLWRRQKYGFWFPNTFAAKNNGIWIESGIRYLLSFFIEYSLWIWLILAFLFLAISLTRLFRDSFPAKPSTWIRSFIFPPTDSLIVMIVVLTLLAHFAYYTFIIGGDHFEYRVYSHLILFIFLSFVWLLNRLNTSATVSLFSLGIFIIASLPVQWIHWYASQPYQTREETFGLFVPLADKFPSVLQPYIQIFDDSQDWLIRHSVAVRHQEHKIFYEYLIERWPTREIGSQISADEIPVIPLGSVGVPSWVLPTTNIIDKLGLNDRVVAHNPVDFSLVSEREMAHSRYAPEGYLECFQPNVFVPVANKIIVINRDFEADDVVACETKEWMLGMGHGVDPSLRINNSEEPELDNYLWTVWSDATQFVYYDPPEMTKQYVNVKRNEHLFSSYTGTACMILPPQESLEPQYIFFDHQTLDTNGMHDLFSWSSFLQGGQTSEPYQVAYVSWANEFAQFAPQYRLSVYWQNGVQLDGYDLSSTNYVAGEQIILTLYYTFLETPSAVDSVYIHLLGDAYNEVTGGPLWSQQDGNLCGSQYPLDRLEPGSRVIANIVLPIPAFAPSGDYVLNTGIYNWQTGERVLPDNEPFESIPLTTITIP